MYGINAIMIIDYFNKAQERYEYASGQVAHTSLRLNTALLSFIFSLLAFFYFSPLVSLIIIIALIPYIIYEINFSKISWGIWSESTDYRDHYFSVVEIFRRDNAQELKIHKSGEYLKNKVTTLNDERYKREMDLTKKRSRFNIFGSFIDTVIYVLSSLYIVYKALIGVIPIGSVVTFFSILANYISSVQFLTGSFIELYELGLFLDDIHNYLDFKLDDEMVNGEIKIKDNKQHKIEFKNVYFKYPKSKRYIFKNLSLTINPGEKIAIVGDNGAGKTTFINLLCRFYTANKGEILIDGVNINDIDILSWYDNLGVLFQDYIKYRFSVNENIRLGDIFKKNSDQNDIIEAAKKAQAHVFIEKFKDQYDTVLSRKGQGTISGGEWQKLALSREFFRDPTILILDEPTSNLDVKSEDNIFRIIEDTSKDKTVILISHRFSTVRNVDRIFVFEKGEILEEGSHQDLMNLKGKYFTLFNIQAKGYK
ncbi:ABC transporter ATP-binding protein/permease [Patescibacteria group bacterium]|nr:ABC transporter ATP-binding protein/permease [Patescibacteria group bacterium]